MHQTLLTILTFLFFFLHQITTFPSPLHPAHAAGIFPRANGTSTSPSTNNACPSATALASGIRQNIAAQRGEQDSTTSLQILQSAANYSSTSLASQAQFQAAKSQLLSFVDQGIAIRQNNQMMAPMASQANRGLAMVAMAQTMELQVASGLTGDPAVDTPMLVSLQSMFSGGIVQNMMNEVDALREC